MSDVSSQQPQTPISPPGARRASWLALGCGGLMTLGTAVFCPTCAGVVSTGAAAVSHGPGSAFFLATLPIALIPVKLGGDAIGRRVGASRMSLATSLGVLFAAASAAVLAMPILHRYAMLEAQGGDWDPRLTTMVCSSVVGLCAGTFVMAIPRRAMRRSLPSIFGPIALSSCVLLALLFGVTVLRSASRPDIQQYERELPFIWLNPPGIPRETPPAPPGRHVGPAPTNWAPRPSPPSDPGPPGVRFHEAKGITVIQDCHPMSCNIRIRSEGADTADPNTFPSTLEQDWDEILHLSVDDRGGIVYVAKEWAPVSHVFERTAVGWVPRAFDPHLLLARTSPPRPWVLVSGLLLAVSVIQWLLRRRAMVHLRALDAARSAFLGEDGVVRFGDGFPPLTLSTPTETQAGPVTVVFGPFAKGELLPSLGTIRGEWVLEGNIDHLREEALLQMLGRDSSILAVTSLAIAPLAAAAAVGLLT